MFFVPSQAAVKASITVDLIVDQIAEKVSLTNCQAKRIPSVTAWKIVWAFCQANTKASITKVLMVFHPVCMVDTSQSHATDMPLNTAVVMLTMPCHSSLKNSMTPVLSSSQPVWNTETVASQATEIPFVTIWKASLVPSQAATNASTTVVWIFSHPEESASAVSVHFSPTRVRKSSTPCFAPSQAAEMVSPSPAKNSTRPAHFSCIQSMPDANASTVDCQALPRNSVNEAHISRPVSVWVKKYISPAVSAVIEPMTNVTGLAAMTRLKSFMPPVTSLMLFCAAIIAPLNMRT